MSENFGEQHANSQSGWRKVRNRIGKVQPRSRAWSAAGALTAVVSIALVIWNVADQTSSGVGQLALTQTVTNVVFSYAVGLVVTTVLFVTYGRFKSLPWLYVAVVIASVFLLLTSGAGGSLYAWLVAVIAIVILTSVIGELLGRGIPTNPGRNKLVLSAAAVVVCAAFIVSFVVDLGHPGPITTPIGKLMANKVSSNPAASGSFAVDRLAYGSSNDKRHAYGSAVEVHSPRVDASKIVTGWDANRTKLWGFDSSNFPLNAKVWLPSDQARHPVVMMVHGNKTGADASEDGFEYLGLTLASNGIVAVSIDENFLNTGLIDKSGGLGGVNLARGWLINKHLKFLEQATGGDSRLKGRLDMSNVGLLGHSRGGEAVSIAAYINQLGHLPDDSNVQVNKVGIKSVMALAPSEGQYKPQSGPIVLNDINYLTLMGSKDADVVSFAGLNQYNNVKLSKDSTTFKAALYIDRADHDQFNSRWGSYDVGNGLPKYFIDSSTLMSPSDQQQIAKIYASNFFQNTLESQESQDLFVDYRAAADFLPKTNYVSMFANDKTNVSAIANAKMSGFTSANVILRPMRLGKAYDSVIDARWKTSTGMASIDQPIPTGALSSMSTITVDATAIGSAIKKEGAVIELKDANGHASRVSLDSYRALTNTPSGQYLDSKWMQNIGDQETVLQTYSVPVSAFADADTSLNPTAVTSMSLQFDKARAGEVMVGNMGFR